MIPAARRETRAWSGRAWMAPVQMMVGCFAGPFRGAPRPPDDKRPVWAFIGDDADPTAHIRDAPDPTDPTPAETSAGPSRQACRDAVASRTSSSPGIPGVGPSPSEADVRAAAARSRRPTPALRRDQPASRSNPAAPPHPRRRPWCWERADTGPRARGTARSTCRRPPSLPPTPPRRAISISSVCSCGSRSLPAPARLHPARSERA